eukprot:96461-Prymnesium_polylepis.1
MSTRVLRSAGPPLCFSSTVTALTPDDEPEPTTCAICLELLVPDDPHVSRLDCGHYFHATCLVSSLTRDPRCPCCRYFSSDFVHPDELEYRSYDSEDDEPDVDPGPSFKQSIKIERAPHGQGRQEDQAVHRHDRQMEDGAQRRPPGLQRGPGQAAPA